MESPCTNYAINILTPQTRQTKRININTDHTYTAQGLKPKELRLYN